MQTPNNKTQRIKQHLLTMIEEGKLPPGGKLPTEKELCDQFNVSRVPVQAALNEMKNNGIIQRIKGSGSFVTGPENKSGSIHSKNIIPFIINESLLSARYLETIRGAENYLQSHNHYLTVHYPGQGKESVREIIDSLIDSGVRSFIILPPIEGDLNEIYFSRLIRQGINLIFIDMIPKGVSGNHVTSDNILGGYLAGKHLIDNGYKNISVLIGHYPFNSSINRRLEGFRLALSEAGLPFCDSQIICLDDVIAQNPAFDFFQAVDILTQSFKSAEGRPDALFCINDTLALIIYHSFIRNNIVIPNDIALIGFDNLPETASAAIPISTIEQSFYSLGYCAAEMCLKYNKSPFEERQHLYLPVKLIERQSSEPKASIND